MKTTSTQRLGLHLLDKAGIEVGGDAPWDIQIHNDDLFARVLRHRELGLGEAYQEGWWDAERVDELLVKVMLADLRSEIRPSLEVAALAARSAVTNRQSVGRAGRNASLHYDTGNDLFERLLDKRMIYSCAYWRHADDLDKAQSDKLELICRKLELEPGMRLLDIGCGWGGFAAYAAANYGVEVTAISPAANQVEVAARVCEDLNVDVRQLDYREVSGATLPDSSAAGAFDRIVSVGMMEHVGPKNLPTFFETCDRLLADGGMMLHHTIGSNESKNRADPWFDKYIFPGGVVPSLEHIAAAAQERWVLEDVHNFGPDYDRTLLAWHDNIEARWGDIPHYDEHFRRTWRYYLLASAASFRVRNLQLWQIVFRRTGRPSPTYCAPR